jgi:chromosome segregation ATPase
LRQEIADLKQKIDSQYNDTEESFHLFKRKQQEQFTELSSHIESLSKTKFKYEKENKQYSVQLDEMRKENEQLSRSKSNAFSTIRDLETKHADAQQRIDDLLRQLNEYNDLKNKLSKEHSDLFRRNASIEFELQQSTLNNKRLNQELDDARLQLENEILVKTSLDNKSKLLQSDLDNVTAQYEEESEARSELQKQYIKLQDDYRLNKESYEKECKLRMEEVEDSKYK